MSTTVDEKPKRGRGRPPGGTVSEAQRAASRQNVKRAQEARRKRKEAEDAKRASGEIEKPRWKQLEDGELSVRDLTAKELRRKACANNDGTWEGKRRKLPQRIINNMEAESFRRARQALDALTGPAMKAIRERIEDSEAPAQQFAAARMVIEYKLGKVPEQVHHTGDNAFTQMTQSAFVVLRGEANVVDSDAAEDIVEAELVEE